MNSALDITFNDASLEGSTLLSAADAEVEAVVSSVNESAYSTIEFDFDVTYNGTELMDVFSVSG